MGEICTLSFSFPPLSYSTSYARNSFDSKWYQNDNNNFLRCATGRFRINHKTSCCTKCNRRKTDRILVTRAKLKTHLNSSEIFLPTRYIILYSIGIHVIIVIGFICCRPENRVFVLSL